MMVTEGEGEGVKMLISHQIATLFLLYLLKIFVIFGAAVYLARDTARKLKNKTKQNTPVFPVPLVVRSYTKRFQVQCQVRAYTQVVELTPSWGSYGSQLIIDSLSH